MGFMFWQKRTEPVDIFMHKIDKHFIILFLITTLSFSVHFVNRNKHFQECDSSLVFYAQKEFPSSAKEYYQWGIPNRYKNILEYRITLIDHVEQVYQNKILPRWMLAALALPYASTYTFGSGVFYGIILSAVSSKYDSFMSVSLIITLLLHHLTVIGLFAVFSNFKIRKEIALIISLLFLFSISHYSYALHLGSTVWNVFTGMLFICVLFSKPVSRNQMRILSGLTGVLVFFNYLIVFYYFAYLLACQQTSKLKMNIVDFLKSQFIVLCALLINLIFFFQPGNAMRGTLSNLKELMTYPCFVVLNFFSFFSGPRSIDLVQLFIFTTLMSIGIIFLFLPTRSNKKIRGYKSFFKMLVTLYLLSVITFIMGFAPSRHILFLSPALFVLLGLSLDNMNILKIKNILNLIIFGVITLGFVGIYVRTIETSQLTDVIRIDPDVSQIVINDCSYELFYKLKNQFNNVVFLKEKSFLEKNKMYIYVSQTIPFSKDIITNDFLIIFNKQFKKNVYFIAHNPEPYKFRHNRPNNLYFCKFLTK